MDKYTFVIEKFKLINEYIIESYPNSISDGHLLSFLGELSATKIYESIKFNSVKYFENVLSEYRENIKDVKILNILEQTSSALLEDVDLKELAKTEVPKEKYITTLDGYIKDSAQKLKSSKEEEFFTTYKSLMMETLVAYKKTDESTYRTAKTLSIYDMEIGRAFLQNGDAIERLTTLLMSPNLIIRANKAPFMTIISALSFIFPGKDIEGIFKNIINNEDKYDDVYKVPGNDLLVLKAIASANKMFLPYVSVSKTGKIYRSVSFSLGTHSKKMLNSLLFIAENFYCLESFINGSFNLKIETPGAVTEQTTKDTVIAIQNIAQMLTKYDYSDPFISRFILAMRRYMLLKYDIPLNNVSAKEIYHILVTKEPDPSNIQQKLSSMFHSLTSQGISVEVSIVFDSTGESKSFLLDSNGSKRSVKITLYEDDVFLLLIFYDIDRSFITKDFFSLLQNDRRFLLILLFLFLISKRYVVHHEKTRAAFCGNMYISRYDNNNNSLINIEEMLDFDDKRDKQLKYSPDSFGEGDDDKKQIHDNNKRVENVKVHKDIKNIVDTYIEKITKSKDDTEKKKHVKDMKKEIFLYLAKNISNNMLNYSNLFSANNKIMEDPDYFINSFLKKYIQTGYIDEEFYSLYTYMFIKMGYKDVKDIRDALQNKKDDLDNILTQEKRQELVNLKTEYLNSPHYSDPDTKDSIDIMIKEIDYKLNNGRDIDTITEDDLLSDVNEIVDNIRKYNEKTDERKEDIESLFNIFNSEVIFDDIKEKTIGQEYNSESKETTNSQTFISNSNLDSYRKFLKNLFSSNHEEPNSSFSTGETGNYYRNKNIEYRLHNVFIGPLYERDRRNSHRKSEIEKESLNVVNGYPNFFDSSSVPEKPDYRNNMLQIRLSEYDGLYFIFVYIDFLDDIHNGTKDKPYGPPLGYSIFKLENMKLVPADKSLFDVKYIYKVGEDIRHLFLIDVTTTNNMSYTVEFSYKLTHVPQNWESILFKHVTKEDSPKAYSLQQVTSLESVEQQIKTKNLPIPDNIILTGEGKEEVLSVTKLMYSNKDKVDYIKKYDIFDERKSVSDTTTLEYKDNKLFKTIEQDMNAKYDSISPVAISLLFKSFLGLICFLSSNQKLKEKLSFNSLFFLNNKSIFSGRGTRNTEIDPDYVKEYRDLVILARWYYNVFKDKSEYIRAFESESHWSEMNKVIFSGISFKKRTLDEEILDEIIAQINYNAESIGFDKLVDNYIHTMQVIIRDIAGKNIIHAELELFDLRHKLQVENKSAELTEYLHAHYISSTNEPFIETVRDENRVLLRSGGDKKEFLKFLTPGYPGSTDAKIFYTMITFAYILNKVGFPISYANSSYVKKVIPASKSNISLPYIDESNTSYNYVYELVSILISLLIDYSDKEGKSLIRTLPPAYITFIKESFINRKKLFTENLSPLSEMIKSGNIPELLSLVTNDYDVKSLTNKMLSLEREERLNFTNFDYKESRIYKGTIEKFMSEVKENSHNEPMDILLLLLSKPSQDPDMSRNFISNVLAGSSDTSISAIFYSLVSLIDLLPQKISRILYQAVLHERDLLLSSKINASIILVPVNPISLLQEENVSPFYFTSLFAKYYEQFVKTNLSGITDDTSFSYEAISNVFKHLVYNL